MQATRRARLESVIHEELSLALPRLVKDPRIPPLTLTKVQVSPDGSQAKIFFSILGSMSTDDSQMTSCLQGLTSASGYLRRHLAKALSVRHIPSLRFQRDLGLDNSMRVHELLKQIEIEKGQPPKGTEQKRTEDELS